MHPQALANKFLGENCRGGWIVGNTHSLVFGIYSSPQFFFVCPHVGQFTLCNRHDVVLYAASVPATFSLQLPRRDRKFAFRGKGVGGVVQRLKAAAMADADDGGIWERGGKLTVYQSLGRLVQRRRGFI